MPPHLNETVPGRTRCRTAARAHFSPPAGLFQPHQPASRGGRLQAPGPSGGRIGVCGCAACRQNLPSAVLSPLFLFCPVSTPFRKNVPVHGISECFAPKMAERLRKNVPVHGISESADFLRPKKSPGIRVGVFSRRPPVLPDPEPGLAIFGPRLRGRIGVCGCVACRQKPPAGATGPRGFKTVFPRFHAES